MADSNSTNKNNLHYLRDLKDYKIAKDEPDVRGWKVQDTNHQTVGTVAGLLVDVSVEKVRYIDVDLDDSLIPADHDPFDAKHKDGIHEFQDKKGNIHMIIPIGVARIEREAEVIVADGIDQNSLRNIPTYRYQQNVPVHSDYEQSVLSNFRKQPGDADRSRELTDDELYNSEHFDEERFYGRSGRRARE
jgi:hypothetical protein